MSWAPSPSPPHYPSSRPTPSPSPPHLIPPLEAATAGQQREQRVHGVVVDVNSSTVHPRLSVPTVGPAALRPRYSRPPTVARRSSTQRPRPLSKLPSTAGVSGAWCLGCGLGWGDKRRRILEVCGKLGLPSLLAAAEDRGRAAATWRSSPRFTKTVAAARWWGGRCWSLGRGRCSAGGRSSTESILEYSSRWMSDGWSSARMHC